MILLKNNRRALFKKITAMVMALICAAFVFSCHDSYAAASNITPSGTQTPLTISAGIGGQDLNMLSIDSIPSALNSNSELQIFSSYMFYFLFSLGIVLSFFEGYATELSGGEYGYYRMLIKTALIAVGYLSWKQQGTANFAETILTLADKIQLYLIGQNIYGIGASVSQLVSSVSGSLHSVSIPTFSSNGTSSVSSGWNLNPVSWFAGAMHALTGTVLIGILWFIFNLFYIVIQFFMAMIQLIFLGLLFALCPIVLGLESIPYTRGIFGKWMQMFVEISMWGVIVALEQLIFFTILSKMISISLPSSGTGMGNILGGLSFAETITVFLVMIVINVSVPYITGKLTGGITGDIHEKIKTAKIAAARAAVGV